MAMLLAALAATIAATLLWQQQRWAGEYERRRDQVQAQALAMAGVQWARQILFENAPPSIVQLGQPWAFRLPTTPIENGSIGGYITDAQGRLNVNNLAGSATVATAAQLALQRLFAELGVPNALLNAIADWVDADDQTTPNGGAEDSYYLAQDPPGLAANAPVRRVAELLAVRGADPTLIARLAPFVDALDAPTTGQRQYRAGGSARRRGRRARRGGRHDPRGESDHQTVRQPRRFPDAPAALAISTVDETTLAVTSDWFVVTIEARQGDTVARARALLRRSTAPRAWPDVVWQTVE